MTACPVCAAPAPRIIDKTPYSACDACGTWFQATPPAKTYHGPAEPGVESMGDAERDVNKALAQHLFLNVMGARPGMTLDVGSKIPVLAACLAREHGCEAYALDAMPQSEAPAVTIAGDFEAMEPADLVLGDDDRYRLITLVHTFEHFADPLAALRKLRRLVAVDGRVFIRMPDHTVAGFERDLTPHHYTIHPFYHCLAGVCEMLWQLRDVFAIESFGIPGAGQRDIVLRPIDKKPTVCAGFIVKNEARDLPRCLRSIESIADAVVVIDTGSTDRTLIVAHTTIDKPVYSRVYLGASVQDGAEWRLQNFAQARNEYMREVGERGFDWLLWMDADDEVVTPAAIRRAAYLPPAAVGVWIDLGNGMRQVHYRLIPARAGVRFRGWCHEYLVLDALPQTILDDACIRHDATPHGDETSNARNLRILEAQYKAEPDARTAFYLGNTHKDGGRFREAAYWYHVRLGYGDAFHDEYLFAVLYLARSLRGLGDDAGADEAARYGAALAPTWQEFRVELAVGLYRAGKYQECINEAARAIGKPVPLSILWREPQAYADQPMRLISWCHEHMGNLPQAFQWSEEATKAIAGHDAEWSRREHLLRGKVAALSAPKYPAVSNARPRIALHRPGAIGDVLMTLNLVPLLREANPDAEIHYFVDAGLAHPHALGQTMLAAGVDLVLDCRNVDAWRKQYDRVVDLVGYPMGEGYPYARMRQHLLRYFAAECGVTLHAQALPSLVLPQPLADPALPKRYATLQTRAGWSAYKEWPAERWAAVVDTLQGTIPFVQIGAASDPKVPGAVHDFMGRSLSDAIAVFANARLHVGIDSFANHLTNFYWERPSGARRVPGVILWGSTQWSAAGYVGNTNISRDLVCQPCFRERPEISRQRVEPCPTPVVVRALSGKSDYAVHKCMAQITVGEVVQAIVERWHVASKERAAA